MGEITTTIDLLRAAVLAVDPAALTVADRRDLILLIQASVEEAAGIYKTAVTG
ncbi:MAG: hypothetical protein NT146_07310 [Mycobacterium sp.]|nr:hypothetical protein [Mycobacterium sp.]